MTTTLLLNLRRALCALLTLSLLSACGGGGDNAPPAAMIGAAGGTVVGPNGAQVVVPAGALSAPVAITITPSAARPLPAGMQGLGTIYDLGPAGTSFAVPVTVTLPLDPTQVPAGARVRMLHQRHVAGADTWEELPGLVVGATGASAQTTSFSHFAVAHGNPPPQITTQPSDAAVTVPGTASFSVNAIGFDAPFTFQWQKSDGAGMNFIDIAGATAFNYTTGATSIAADHGDRYRVLVSNVGGTSTSASATLTVTSTAPTTATLTVSVIGGGSVTGSVTGSPAGIDCGADCTETYALNTVVTLTPSAAAGFTFSAWSGDADCADASVTMSAARACTATFTATTGSLTGSWISNYQCTGTGGNFNGQDTLSVTQTGTSVSFTASDGGVFTGTLNGNTMTYSGGGPGYTETGTWTMRGADSFTKTSNYVRTDGSGTGGSCPGAGQRQGVPFTLLVIVTGNGRVSDGSGGINLCEPASGDCTQAFPSGTQVTLSATGNAPGVVFNGWGAACFDVPSPLAARVVMDSSKTCTASFSP